MIELPEAHVLAAQINQTLTGKTVKRAAANVHPHGFAGYTGDPAEYPFKLNGKTLGTASGGAGDSCACGGYVEVPCGDMQLGFSTPIKYHAPGEKLPKSHQFILEFTDGSHMTCTVQMWGSMLCFPRENAKERKAAKPDPLTDAFDAAYFDGLYRETPKNYSVKAFLATEQRIPGLGNGVCQDILWNARLHPKRKLETLTDADQDALFASVKSTLKDMRGLGGRDTERDLFGKPGGYKTILSAKTLAYPCMGCGGGLVRQAFLGGNIYFCPVCQAL
jgi:formamidopyrimidine-DNA glycosylase